MMHTATRRQASHPTSSIRHEPASTLIRRHQRRIFALTQLMMGNLEEAEQVTQQVLLAVLRAKPRTPELADGMVNSCLMEALGVMRHDQLSARDYFSSIPAAPATEPLDAPPTADEARAALAAIPAPLRLIYLLNEIYCAEHPHPTERISLLLGLDPPFCKHLLFRARQLLVAQIGARRAADEAAAA